MHLIEVSKKLVVTIKLTLLFALNIRFERISRKLEDFTSQRRDTKYNIGIMFKKSQRCGEYFGKCKLFTLYDKSG